MNSTEAYEAPSLELVGTVTELTAGSNHANSDGNGYNSAYSNGYTG